MTNGLSSAVSRLLRSLHRRHSDELQLQDAASLLSASGPLTAPKTAALPSGFTRHVRHLVDYLTLLAKSPGSTRRVNAVAKALERVRAMLDERHDNDASVRSMPLNAVVELLITVWECALRCLDLTKTHATPAVAATLERLSTCSSTSSNTDDSTRLERTARELLALLFHQKEFDWALMALGRGECNIHHGDQTRKRSVHDEAKPERDELRVSLRRSRRGSIANSHKRPPVPRPLPSKRDVSSASDASLCHLVKKYADLHQTTLRLLLDAHIAAGNQLDGHERPSRISDRGLLLHLLAVSYVRVPVLRETMLAVFHHSAQYSNGRRRREELRQQRKRRASSVTRSRSASLHDEVNGALFRWTQNLSTKCQGGVGFLLRDASWSKEAAQVAKAARNAKFQRVFVAELIDHFLTIAGDGGIDWKCLAGASILKETVLTITESVFQIQLRQAEASMHEGDAEGSALKNADLSRQSFTLSTSDDWTIAVFLEQSTRMLRSNVPLIHDWMMTILLNTNYMVAHHVTLCLRHLSQLMTQFPAYFSSDNTTAIGSAVDATVLCQVFSRLLKSEHFEILRTTELFLMKHFSGFSVSLREALVQVFAGEFKRLFLHWNRDVRFCFYHMLLYLTYPGNRLVLCAKSDELLMGAESAQLFEIPGLVRFASETATKWDAFDQPLCELITHVNRVAKQNSKLLVMGPASHAQPRSAGRPSSSQATTRASMTLRPKPAMRASLTARPSHARFASHNSKTPSGMLGKCSSMSALPLKEAVATPPASAPAAVSTLPPVPQWIQQLAFSTVQRSVLEYRGHVETYFRFARQISLHDAVPIPTLQAVKANA